jgi:hypothetical protein
MCRLPTPTTWETRRGQKQASRVGTRLHHETRVLARLRWPTPYTALSFVSPAPRRDYGVHSQPPSCGQTLLEPQSPWRTTTQAHGQPERPMFLSQAPNAELGHAPKSSFPMGHGNLHMQRDSARYPRHRPIGNVGSQSRLCMAWCFPLGWGSCRPKEGGPTWL